MFESKRITYILVLWFSGLFILGCTGQDLNGFTQHDIQRALELEDYSERKIILRKAIFNAAQYKLTPHVDETESDLYLLKAQSFLNYLSENDVDSYRLFTGKSSIVTAQSGAYIAFIQQLSAINQGKTFETVIQSLTFDLPSQYGMKVQELTRYHWWGLEDCLTHPEAMSFIGIMGFGGIAAATKEGANNKVYNLSKAFKRLWPIALLEAMVIHIGSNIGKNGVCIKYLWFPPVYIGASPR